MEYDITMDIIPVILAISFRLLSIVAKKNHIISNGSIIIDSVVFILLMDCTFFCKFFNYPIFL